MWNGPVNEHVKTDLFVGTALGEANAFHLEFAAVLERLEISKVEPLVGEVLFLDRNLRIDCLFATALQALV